MLSPTHEGSGFQIPLLGQGGVARSAGMVRVADSMTHLGSLYLVPHEIVHLAIPDHSQRFWLTVQSLCPETERAKQWLCANGARLYFNLTLLEQTGRSPESDQ